MVCMIFVKDLSNMYHVDVVCGHVLHSRHLLSKAATDHLSDGGQRLGGIVAKLKNLSYCVMDLSATSLVDYEY